MNEKIKKFANAAANAAVGMSRTNYFDSRDRGEVSELKADLNSEYEVVRKEALKKVVAGMTAGRDVSVLFPHVLKCMQTGDLEAKKLVYLYLMRYAKDQPDMAIMAVNSFCKDTEDKNPMIRALALRTMGSMRVEQMVDYVCEPVRRAATDDHPYVRKTAAMCIGKVFFGSREVAEENGLDRILLAMLRDTNLAVVGNVVAVLGDLRSRDIHLPGFIFDSALASRLADVLQDASEWSQCYILDLLVDYAVGIDTTGEAQVLIDRLVPRLAHANHAVVVGTVKVLLAGKPNTARDVWAAKGLDQRISSALTSIIATSAPEMQYIVLCSLQLLLQKFPEVAPDLKLFYCRFSDPLWLRREKLNLLIMLCSHGTLEQVLGELEEYAKEVHEEWVRLVVDAIGKLADRLISSRKVIIGRLLGLAQSRVGHLLQSVCITLRKILNPADESDTFYDLSVLFDADLGVYEDPEARAALLWLAGESVVLTRHPHKGTSVLSRITNNFAMETLPVQFQLLDSAWTMAVSVEEEAEDNLSSKLFQDIAILARESRESVDLREHAFLLERLLIAVERDKLRQAKYEALQSISRSKSNAIMSTQVLNKLVQQFGSLSSVQHRVIEYDPNRIALVTARLDDVSVEDVAPISPAILVRQEPKRDFITDV